MNSATIDRNIKRFETIINESIQREGIQNLMGFITKSDFYSAPASTKYHLSCEGGLLQHSLNVYDALKGRLAFQGGTYRYIVSGNPVATITPESIAIMTLFHDLCKTYFYGTEMKNQKVYSDTGSKRDNGGRFDWMQVPSYVVDDRVPYGHGEKSVMMIEEYMKLLPTERYAIRWHMGFAEGNDNLTLNQAITKYPIVWALHSADMEASHYMEDCNGNRAGFTDQDAAQPAGAYADNPTTEPFFEEAAPLAT